jgi:hypothetical protein
MLIRFTKIANSLFSEFVGEDGPQEYNDLRKLIFLSITLRKETTNSNYITFQWVNEIIRQLQFQYQLGQ